MPSSRPWWTPYAITGVAAAAALALLTWQVAIGGLLVAADWPVHQFFDARQPDGPTRAVLDGAAKLGQRWLTLPILLATAGWVCWRQRRVLPMVATVVGLGTLYVVGNAIKFGLGRTPPAHGSTCCTATPGVPVGTCRQRDAHLGAGRAAALRRERAAAGPSPPAPNAGAERGRARGRRHRDGRVGPPLAQRHPRRLATRRTGPRPGAPGPGQRRAPWRSRRDLHRGR